MTTSYGSRRSGVRKPMAENTSRRRTSVAMLLLPATTSHTVACGGPLMASGGRQGGQATTYVEEVPLWEAGLKVVGRKGNVHFPPRFHALAAPLPSSFFYTRCLIRPSFSCTRCPPSLLVFLHSLPLAFSFSALAAPLPSPFYCIRCPPSLFVFLLSLPPLPSPFYALVALLPPSFSCVRCPPCFLVVCSSAMFFAPAVPYSPHRGREGTARAKS